jgi:hypothetical protein
MKILKKIFQNNDKQEKPEELSMIAREIGPLIFQIADDIFRSYSVELLASPIDYIVPAVWGAKKDGELTSFQKEINQKILLAVKEITQVFEFRELSNAQAFAIGYLIRELFISKIVFMTELLKHQSVIEYGSEPVADNILNHMEPIGTA